jgi:Flp pilus assembly protein TadG
MMLSVQGNLRATRIAPITKGFPEHSAKLGRAPGSRPCKRRGAVTVELAVVAPIVFVVILGIFEIGRGLMVIHLLNNAAQAGCRAGIIEGQSTANIKTMVTNTLTSTGIKGDTVTVQVNDGSTDASSALAGDEITVKVSVPVSSVTWLPFTQFLTGSLQGQYTMRRE